MPGWAKGVGVALLFLTGLGLLHGIFSGGFYAMWRDGSAAGWPWWYYVLAVPALGAAVLVFEGVVEAVGLTIGALLKKVPGLGRAIYLTFTLGFITAMVVFIAWMILRGPW